MALDEKSDLTQGGRNFPNAGGSGQRQFRRPQRNNRPHRRFPNRPSIFQQQPRPRPQQQTLRDTFDYQDDVPEFLQNKEEDVEYYDEEINFNEQDNHLYVTMECILSLSCAVLC